MKNIAKSIFAALLLTFVCQSVAARNDSDERASFNSIYLNGGLGTNDSSWNLELGYIFYFNDYIGVGAGFQIDNEIGEQGLIASLTDNNEDDYNRLLRINFMPQFSVRTPGIRFKNDSKLFLQFAPGLMLSVPNNDKMYLSDPDQPPHTGPYGQQYRELTKVKNSGGQWLYWRLKSALCYGNDRAYIALGYTATNYSIYDCRRNMVFKGKHLYDLGRRKLNGNVFLEISVDI